ncbi:MAG: translation initiation factor Sui1 [Magnetococcales bacterium]|nr:translation initiation factor Sui1 [Magnetococcales bacterium]MBF0148864.1 translation initiation factor Sui1 [Magnetococcales bacterium]MBF0173136.1 translation initiation factor Sui1 [Magnetococcales bacterium]MBF0346355.1 translation initiation factor Sui1 [Magnetococcales bacterium]MBF0629801.1 translation initiation factor Sui1 [Magnetococcales bacterium]
MKNKPTRDRIVYSTEIGRICPECGQPLDGCTCKLKSSQPASTGMIRVSRETKGRKGKEVTLIKGLDPDPTSLEQMGKKIKAMCGSGGTVKDGTIEIQGNHIDRVMSYLQQQGLTVKRAGG